MDHNARVGTILILFVLLAGAASFSAYRSNLFGLFTPERVRYDQELLDMVSVSGGFRLDELNLSNDEIRTINYAALSHKNTFPRIGLTLDPVSKRKPSKVGRMTFLNFSMTLQTKGQTEVQFWKRKVVRRDLVPSMVDSLKMAAEEYIHFRDMPERKAPIIRLYL